jgi:hypothetical protein
MTGTRDFCAALRLRPFDFAAWDAIVSAAEDVGHPAHQQLLTEGRAITHFFQVEVERLANGALAMPITLRLPDPDPDSASAGAEAQTVRGLAVNASGLFASELGHLLAQRSGTFGLVWNLAADGEIKSSLRACGAVDVARIATRYGGGGHPNAAGFRLAPADFLPMLASGDPPPDTPPR